MTWIYCLCRAKILVLILFCVSPMMLVGSMMEQDSVLSPEQFGPIEPRITNMYLCKGPKKINCTDMSLELAGGYDNLTFRISFKKPTQFMKTKMAIWRRNDDGEASPDITKWMDKPCNHFFLGPLLKQYLKVGNRCVVPKSNIVASVNITHLFHELMGLQFFFGSYKSQTLVMSNECNIACVVTEFALFPKSSKSRKI